MIYFYIILSLDGNEILKVINRHQENKNCTDNVFDIL